MKDYGGMAFPTSPSHYGSADGVYGGMTLRDYFAGQALMSMLSPIQEIGKETPALAAELAYRFADAMIEEREK